MKALVVYDSVYGNTREIAEAVGVGLGDGSEVAQAGSVGADGMGGVDLLVVGSPTHGGRPTEAVQGFLASIPGSAADGLRVASFDTRYESRFVKMFGFAADRTARSLEAKGAILVSPPEPFFVTKKKGPLKAGERERATGWGRSLRERMSREGLAPEKQ